VTFGAYLLRGASARLAVALPAAALLYFAFELGDRGPALAQRAGWSSALATSLLHLPLIAVLVLPAALLLSIALWISRLRSGGELEAAACLGRGPAVVARPLLLLGVLCSAVALTTSELVVPPCERAAAQRSASTPSALTGLGPTQPWQRHGAWLVHGAPGAARRFVAVELDARAAIRQRLEGSLADGAPPRLRDARHYRFAERGFSAHTRAAASLPSAWADALHTPTRVEAQGFAHLRRDLVRGSAAGRAQRVDALMLHAKLAFPLLNLVVAAAGVGLAFGPRSRAPVSDLLRVAALLLGLWALLAAGWMLCRAGMVGPAAGAWGPLGLAALLASAGLGAAARNVRGRTPAGADHEQR
jgi:lipopolysaccharide export LptBFGC system permease protein LptF